MASFLPANPLAEHASSQSANSRGVIPTRWHDGSTPYTILHQSNIGRRTLIAVRRVARPFPSLL